MAEDDHIEVSSSLRDHLAGIGNLDIDGTFLIGAYVMAAGHLNERAGREHRRDVDFDVSDVPTICELEPDEIGAVCEAMVTAGLWARISPTSYRLLGLNRWVRLPSLKVQALRAR
jgi:hypothetical protein